MTGDGDYLPLLLEIQRQGKQVFVAAFSAGLNPMLKRRADQFYLLDATAFSP